MPSQQAVSEPKKSSDWNKLLDENKKNLRQRTLIRLVTLFIIGLSILALLIGCGTKPVVVVNSPKVSLPAYYQEDFQQLPELVSTKQSNTVLDDITPVQ